MSREGQIGARRGLLSRRIKKSTCAYRLAEIKRFPEVSSTTIRDQIELKTVSEEVLNWIPADIRDDVLKTYQKKPNTKEQHN